MRSLSLAFALGLVATPAFAGDAPKGVARGGEGPQSVVELFTSQGCSSCPPADRLAHDLSEEGRVLVLTLPVDYWDYLGWKDTLANPANSARQRAYAMARGDRKVFTPQIVVNGQDSVVGGDKRAVDGALARPSAKSGLALPVEVSVEDGRVEVAVAGPSGPLAETHGEVWAFSVERSRDVEIGRGENAGRTVTYANVVRHMTRLGVWEGGPVRFEVPAEEVMGAGADSVAVLVQTGTGGRPGVILGAARADAPPVPPAATTASALVRDPY